MSSRSNLESLPSELLYMICGYLTDSSLFSVLRTSRHLYHHALPTLQRSALADRGSLLPYSIAHDHPALLQLLLFSTSSGGLSDAVNDVLGVQYNSILGPTTHSLWERGSGRHRNPLPKRCRQCGKHSLSSLAAVLPLIKVTMKIIRRAVKMSQTRGAVYSWTELLLPYTQSDVSLFRAAFRAMVSSACGWDPKALELLLSSPPPLYPEKKRIDLTNWAYKSCRRYVSTSYPPIRVLIECGYPHPNASELAHLYWEQLLQATDSNSYWMMRFMLSSGVPISRLTLEKVGLLYPELLAEFIPRYPGDWDVPLLRALLQRHVAGQGWFKCFDEDQPPTLEDDIARAAWEAMQKRLGSEEAVRAMFRQLWEEDVERNSPGYFSSLSLPFGKGEKKTIVNLGGERLSMTWCTCRGGRMRAVARLLEKDVQMAWQWRHTRWLDVEVGWITSQEELERAAAELVWGTTEFMAPWDPGYFEGIDGVGAESFGVLDGVVGLEEPGVGETEVSGAEDAGAQDAGGEGVVVEGIVGDTGVADDVGGAGAVGDVSGDVVEDEAGDPVGDVGSADKKISD